MAVQLKTAEDNNASLQQALKSEIESRMQLEGTLWFTCHHAELQIMWSSGMVYAPQFWCDVQPNC